MAAYMAAGRETYILSEAAAILSPSHVYSFAFLRPPQRRQSIHDAVHANEQYHLSHHHHHIAAHDQVQASAILASSFANSFEPGVISSSTVCTARNTRPLSSSSTNSGSNGISINHNGGTSGPARNACFGLDLDTVDLQQGIESLGNTLSMRRKNNKRPKSASGSRDPYGGGKLFDERAFVLTRFGSLEVDVRAQQEWGGTNMAIGATGSVRHPLVSPVKNLTGLPGINAARFSQQLHSGQRDRLNNQLRTVSISGSTQSLVDRRVRGQRRVPVEQPALQAKPKR
jgi:hypothetical protein